MAALNKQQAMLRQRENAKRTTSYGAEPGEVTSGLKPGDRVYDPSTNTWQLKNAAPANDIENYIDTIIDASGITGAPNAGTSGKSGSTGSGGAGTGEEGTDTEEGSKDSNGNWIIPAAIAAAGAGAIAAWIAKRSKKSSSAGAGDPANDTAGEADKGGNAETKAKPMEGDVIPPRQGSDLVTSQEPFSGYDDILDAYYTEQPDQPRLDGPTRAAAEAAGANVGASAGALPSPDAEVLPPFNTIRAVGVPPAAPQAPVSQANPSVVQGLLPEPRDPQAQAWLDSMNEQMRQASLKGMSDPLNQSIASVDSPDQALMDPDMEAQVQAMARQMLEQEGGMNTYMDPSVNPDIANMDPYVMRRLQSILRSAR